MLPPEDRQRSPHTGWTRAHWEHVADLLLAGLRPFATPDRAAILVPGAHPSSDGAQHDGLEGFARSFLLAAYRLAGSGGSAPGDLAAWYADGLRAGTTPGGSGAWPTARELRGAVVEGAFVAMALAETAPWIWNELDDRTRQHVVAWLAEIGEAGVYENNWLLFPVIVEAFLKSVGALHRQDVIDRNLDRIDELYRDHGWYTDGSGRHYDYYVGWALHYETLMWCRLDGDRSDPARAGMYRNRSRAFLEQYRYFFAGNGAPVYHGRSLPYRFATAAPLWAGALLDASPLSPGETRRLASGTLRYFLEHGAVRDGVLTLGWHGEFLPMLQPYVGPGSPYWASKAFLGLLLPADHPVWSATEEPSAVERGDFCVAMPEPGFLVRGTQRDGIVRLASHRSDHAPRPRYLPGPDDREDGERRLWRAATRGARAAIRVLRRADVPAPRPFPADPHYTRLAYSSHAAPDFGVDSESLGADSRLTLRGPDGNAAHRYLFHRGLAVDRFATSFWYRDEARREDRMETATVARGGHEIRVHHVSTTTGLPVRDGGFSIAGSEPLEVVVDERSCRIRRADGLTSFAGALFGLGNPGACPFEDANPFGPHSAAPYVASTGGEPIERVYVSLIALTGIELDLEAMLDEIDVEVAGRQVMITCTDGERFFVQLAGVEPVELPFGDANLSGPVRFARVSPDGTSYTHRE